MPVEPAEPSPRSVTWRISVELVVSPMHEATVSMPGPTPWKRTRLLSMRRFDPQAETAEPPRARTFARRIRTSLWAKIPRGASTRTSSIATPVSLANTPTRCFASPPLDWSATEESRSTPSVSMSTPTIGPATAPAVVTATSSTNAAVRMPRANVSPLVVSRTPSDAMLSGLSPGPRSTVSAGRSEAGWFCRTVCDGPEPTICSTPASIAGA